MNIRGSGFVTWDTSGEIQIYFSRQERRRFKIMMEKRQLKPEDLKYMRTSLFLKAIIVTWSFYLATRAETWPESIFYLCVSVLFAGFFIFQFSKYRSFKKQTTENAK